MKLSKLRQIYQSLPESSKNIKWRRLSEKELDIAMCEPQVISNCYDESTRYSLLASEKGRDLIKNVYGAVRVVVLIFLRIKSF